MSNQARTESKRLTVGMVIPIINLPFDNDAPVGSKAFDDAIAAASRAQRAAEQKELAEKFGKKVVDIEAEYSVFD